MRAIAGTYALGTVVGAPDTEVAVLAALHPGYRNDGARPGSSIYGTITHTVTLGSGVYSNPLTVASTGVIAPTAHYATGLFVPANSIEASVLNQGHIAGGNTGPGVRGVRGGIGVDLATAGTLANDGVITGGNIGSLYLGYGGIAVELASGGTVTNNGTIAGGNGGADFFTNSSAGVDLASGGTLINNGTVAGGSALVRFVNVYGGGDGVDSTLGGIIVNNGVVTGGTGGSSSGQNSESGGGGTGVSLVLGGTLLNASVITGGYGGASYYYGNSGGSGVSLGPGGTVINRGAISGGTGASAGLFGSGQGGVGVFLGGGTLVNSGTVSGGTGGHNRFGSYASSGAAVQFGTAAATLIIDHSAVFNGQIVANATVADVLELGGTGAGALSGLGAQFLGFSRLGVEAQANWSLAGSNSLAGGSTIAFGQNGVLSAAGSLRVDGNLTLSGQGTLAVQRNGSIEIGTAGLTAASRVNVDAGSTLSGTGRVAGCVIDNGRITAAGGTLAVTGGISGVGTATIDRNSVLFVGGPLATTGLSFASGGGETLRLGQPFLVTARISGFGKGDMIDLLRTRVRALSFAHQTLRLITPGGSVAALHFAGSFASSHFMLSSDHHSGTNITFG